MRSQVRPDHPLHKLFRGLVEQVFIVEVGVCDPALTDYLGGLLIDFLHIDRIYRLQRVDGETIREVSRMEAEACLGPRIDGPQRARLINQYIGDFTLFWTGVYPEHLRPRGRHGPDRLREYLLQGKRSYSIAGELSDADADPPGAVLRRLSAEFEGCVHGLNLVRQGWQAHRE